MRRLVALASCALYLAFSSIAGTAHVHRAADGHDELPGLHLDHAHIGHATDHGPDGHHRRAPVEPRSRVERPHVARHDGDALELDVAACGLSGPGLRVTPATVVTTVTVDGPSFVTLRHGVLSRPLRDPPGRSAVPARAPPA